MIKCVNLLMKKKFSLIRNKLAYGDFTYNKKSNEVLIKCKIDNEEVISIMNFIVL